MISTDWTIHNDLQSVTVGINRRLGLCRKRGEFPVLIRLGVKHTALFLQEARLQFIPNKKPSELFHSGLVWDDASGRLCYDTRRRLVPFCFNDKSIYGIVVVGERKVARDANKEPQNKEPP